uniref:S41 family peptidase n=1 Tax=Roseihalotalea indica TaxID=2867963 RepID=A0AA49JIP3_9BACT|nr:S41 family peptidase [Tunicatimonas sp. TK19036]
MISIILISCHESALEEIGSPKSFTDIFELFWEGMNRNYVYWDIDSTDWDETYHDYFPLFAALNMNDDRDVIKSVDYFREMTAHLIDGHFSISFAHPLIDDVTINPLLERRTKANKLHYFYTYLPYDTAYLDSGYALGLDYTNSGFNNPLIVLCGTINQDIIYFSCNYFGLVKSYYTNPTGDVYKVLEHFFSLLETLPNAKAAIIDVRGNPGGDLADLDFILGRFVDKPLHFGYSQYKRNDGRLEFTDWINAYITPTVEGKKTSVPLAVLADNYSASLSETFVMAIQSMPNTLFLGERTWGATGPIVDQEIYESGSFKVENFMSVQASSCKFKSLDNQIYESNGLIPDIIMPYSSEAYVSGIDLQLEKILELLNK